MLHKGVGLRDAQPITRSQAQQALEGLANHMRKVNKQDEHLYFWDWYENSTARDGVRQARIRIFQHPQGQEGIDKIMAKVTQQLPEASFHQYSWSRLQAPMCGSQNFKVRNNVLSIWYISYSK